MVPPMSRPRHFGCRERLARLGPSSGPPDDRLSTQGPMRTVRRGGRPTGGCDRPFAQASSRRSRLRANRTRIPFVVAVDVDGYAWRVFESRPSCAKRRHGRPGTPRAAAQCRGRRPRTWGCLAPQPPAACEPRANGPRSVERARLDTDEADVARDLTILNVGRHLKLELRPSEREPAELLSVLRRGDQLGCPDFNVSLRLLARRSRSIYSSI
jgi:hypothetical protein